MVLLVLLPFKGPGLLAEDRLRSPPPFITVFDRSTSMRRKPKKSRPGPQKPTARNRRRTGNVETGPAVARPQAATRRRNIPPRLRTALRWATRIGVAAGLAYAVMLGVEEGYEYATTSPRFEVRGLTFAPTAHVDDERLRQLMALEHGTNILSLDLDALADRIVADPWVAEARVTRVLPDTLDVQVIEHEPVAVLLAGEFFLVDAHGRPFKPLEPGQRGVLPIVTGLDGTDLLRSPELAKSRIDTALQVLRLYGAKLRPRLSEINVDDTGFVTLYTAELGSELRLGRENFEGGLARYDALRAALGEEADKLAVAHLDGHRSPDDRDRVVASFFPSQSTPTLVAAAEERLVAQAEAADQATAERTAPSRAGGPPGRRSSRIPHYE